MWKVESEGGGGVVVVLVVAVAGVGVELQQSGAKRGKAAPAVCVRQRLHRKAS